MKFLPAVLLTIGGVFVLSKVAVAGAATRLNFTVASVQLATINLNSVLNVVILVQNPTGQSFTINSLVGNVLLNGSLIGNLSGFSQTIVAGNSQVGLPLVVSLSTIATLSDIYQVLNGSTGGHAVVTVQGTANVDNLPIPINITYTVL